MIAPMYQTQPPGTLNLLAIRHHLPIDALADSIAQYPTYNEAITTAAEQLAADLPR